MAGQGAAQAGDAVGREGAGFRDGPGKMAVQPAGGDGMGIVQGAMQRGEAAGEAGGEVARLCGRGGRGGQDIICQYADSGEL